VLTSTKFKGLFHGSYRHPQDTGRGKVSVSTMQASPAVVIMLRIVPIGLQENNLTKAGKQASPPPFLTPENIFTPHATEQWW
jgi:hypothetical protein